MPKMKDGTILSSYFSTGKRPSGSDIKHLGNKVLLGQVEKVHFTDDPTNVSKQFVEYDVSVRNEQGGQTVFKNIRHEGRLGGFNDYEETILEPNEQALSGKLDKSNFFVNKNGTLVYVAFRDNSLEKPYIEGTVDHPRNVGATKEDGIRKKGEFRGFEWEITKKGALNLKYQGNRNAKGDLEREDTGPTQIGIDENGNFSFSNNEDQILDINRVDKKITLSDSKTSIEMDKENDKVTMSTSAGVTVTMDGSSKKVELTTGSTTIVVDGNSGKIELTGSLVDVGEAASELAVLGSQLINWLSTHTHNAPQAPGGILATTPPLTPPPQSILSASVKVKS